jgi:hypothetical protein
LDGEILCEEVDGRVACSTPFLYPDGDSVVVYVTANAGRWEITDYGEAVRAVINRPGLNRRSFALPGGEIARDLGIHFSDGRFLASARSDSLGDVVWRVAQASSDLARIVTAQRAEPRREKVFADEVEQALRERGVASERESRLVGASGHTYRPTLFVPSAELIIEPMAPEGIWNAAAAAYVEFGDLRRSNGYRGLAVFDDRERQPDEDVLALLLQVADTANWTRREKWIEALSRTGDDRSR